jgi:hypothetical protein
MQDLNSPLSLTKLPATLANTDCYSIQNLVFLKNVAHNPEFADEVSLHKYDMGQAIFMPSHYFS